MADLDSAGRPARILIALAVAVLALTLAAIAIAAPPPNDDFASAQTLTSTGDSVSGNNLEATGEPGEPPERGGGDPAASSVWYRWDTPTFARSATFSTCQSDFDHDLEVFRGSTLAGLSEASADFTFCGENGQRLRLIPQAGVTYWVRVNGPLLGGTVQRGTFTMLAEAEIRPPERYDLRMRQTVSPRAVRPGQVVIAKLLVENIGNQPSPGPQDDNGVFASQSINKPAFKSDPGKGRLLSVRGRNMQRCSKGFFVRVPVAGCRVKPLAPGETAVMTTRIRVERSILLDSDLVVSDDNPRNDRPETVVRVRR